MKLKTSTGKNSLINKMNKSGSILYLISTNNKEILYLKMHSPGPMKDAQNIRADKTNKRITC